jgi:hypothetical protein
MRMDSRFLSYVPCSPTAPMPAESSVSGPPTPTPATPRCSPANTRRAWRVQQLGIRSTPQIRGELVLVLRADQSADAVARGQASASGHGQRGVARQRRQPRHRFPHSRVLENFSSHRGFESQRPLHDCRAVQAGRLARRNAGAFRPLSHGQRYRRCSGRDQNALRPGYFEQPSTAFHDHSLERLGRSRARAWSL